MSDSDAAVNVLNITLAVSHVATALCYVALLATTPRRLHVPWRERLFSWMSRSSIGLLLITLNALFSLLSCALFVYETYLPQDVAPPIWLVAAEVAMQRQRDWRRLLWLVPGSVSETSTCTASTGRCRARTWRTGERGEF